MNEQHYFVAGFKNIGKHCVAIAANKGYETYFNKQGKTELNLGCEICFIHALKTWPDFNC